MGTIEGFKDGREEGLLKNKLLEHEHKNRIYSKTMHVNVIVGSMRNVNLEIRDR